MKARAWAWKLQLHHLQRGDLVEEKETLLVEHLAEGRLEELGLERFSNLCS